MPPRLTSARKAILEELETSETHLTAAQLHERLSERLPSLNLSTVYRSLDYLSGHQLISVSDLGIGSPVYELVTEEAHHHLVCTTCQAIFPLEDEIVKPFFEQVENSHEITIITKHLVLFGLCKHCKE